MIMRPHLNFKSRQFSSSQKSFILTKKNITSKEMWRTHALLRSLIENSTLFQHSKTPRRITFRACKLIRNEIECNLFELKMLIAEWFFSAHTHTVAHINSVLHTLWKGKKRERAERNFIMFDQIVGLSI
jgi:hypothetical protein